MAFTFCCKYELDSKPNPENLNKNYKQDIMTILDLTSISLMYFFRYCSELSAAPRAHDNCPML